ncbi:glycosyltransferase family 2 protein [Microbacterium sp. NPDC091313]
MSAAVPGNRWDLLDGEAPHPLPRVSVIVAHYDQPGELARTLAALARQDYPAELLEIVVADDGSAVPPAVGPGVVLVRQPDRGFRLAAVRNLGVRAATGSVLCFLDADTAPEPGYVRALTRLPALHPDAVTVGRRRHADLAGAPAQEPIELAGAARALPEPAWLAEAYARSRDLLDADDRSYRYVIGAVAACSRALFDEIGGFDESFTEYGGEDWEWAHRAWQAGALLAHVPDAVAWHDGPDWAGRDSRDRAAAANRQALRLAAAITVDGSAGLGLLPRTADVLVHLRGRHGVAASVVCVDGILRALPRALVLVDEPPAGPLADDARVRWADAPPPDARVVVEVSTPFALAEDDGRELSERLRTLGGGEEGRLRIAAADGVVVATAESRRARRRSARWGGDGGFATGRLVLGGSVVLGAEPHLEAWFGGWAGPAQLG